MERYILTKAIKTKDNEIIPIWSDRLSVNNFECDEDGSFDSLILDKSKRIYSEPIDCVLDILTKKISIGIELNVLLLVNGFI